MIMGSFDRIATVSAHDHENGRPDGETSRPTNERVWQTVTVTSGRIIIGWRGATQKVTEFFRRTAPDLALRPAKLAAFGAPRRPGVKAEGDPLVAALRESGAPVVTLVAKSHDRHVLLALRTTLEENLAMIADTVSHLRENGQRVFPEAEHFFDGYRSNPDYALEVVSTAMRAGADLVALCDTNGGMMPNELGDVVTAVRGRTQARLGIHCHDDTACGVANTLVAVDAGVTHVQGTANGYGERAGNANLFSVVAGLQLKKGRQVLPEAGLQEMSRIAHAISEVTNVAPDTHQPYVGLSAFAHKAGLHASAIKVDPMLYQHIDPALVGNDMRMLVSDMAGPPSGEIKGKQLGYDLPGDNATDRRGVERVSDLEAQGCTFAAADASLAPLLRGEPAGARRCRRRKGHRRRHVEHGRRGGEHHRRFVARPGGSGHLRPPPRRPPAGRARGRPGHLTGNPRGGRPPARQPLRDGRPP